MSISGINRENSKKIRSIRDFTEAASGGIFVRLIGENASFASDVEFMDRTLSREIYKRFSTVPRLMNSDETQAYIAEYENWVRSGCRKAQINIVKSGNVSDARLGDILKELTDIFSAAHKCASPSVEKSFIVTTMYRLDKVFSGLTARSGNVKLVFSNVVKLREYLSCYAAALLGADVMLLQNRCDAEECAKLLGLSEGFVIGRYGETSLPDRSVNESSAYLPAQANGGSSDKSSHSAPSGNIKLKIPPKPGRRSTVECSPMPSPLRQPAPVHKPTIETPRREKSYEELAALAGSVVQIFVLNKPDDVSPDGEIRARSSGSGVMISESGYILTNFHVVSGGRCYGVRIENEEKLYFTDRIVKYHSDYDLAVIKIERKLSPLPIYKGSRPLVRGQRVVAIGSPMGLFNTVSDGIISGFRSIDGVDMIQFTAPISAGSSGGALLDMTGSLIGISSAGLESDRTAVQNINLAVGCETILSFCGQIVCSSGALY